jgi:crotonobetainyl-CoA:carnitine CoA-transferase CaiB-like acyl-CoA transferase
MTTSQSAEHLPRVLEGVRVVDFTERMQGPYGTQILGDFGAEVIKIERPDALTPDGRPDARYGEDGNFGSDAERPIFYPAGFLAANRNKKSVAIDLKSDQGRAIVERLVRDCDVVYENFRPGVMERLGFGYDQCREMNPSIIYASASGYGSDGPYVHRPGQDVLVQGISGFGAINVSGSGRPTPVGMSIADLLGGMNGATAVLAALLHRERTGEGQRVTTNLLDSAIAAQSEQAVHFLNSRAGEPVRGTPMHAHPYIPPPYGFYSTKDGHIALSSGRQIAQVCQILGIEDLSQDPDYADVRDRDANRVAFEERLEAALRRRTTSEWLALMEPEDLFVAPVNSFEEAFRDPQVVHNQMVQTFDSPLGELRLLSPPYKMGRTPPTIRSIPPLHGQHTREVLEQAGFTSAEIDDLVRARVVVAQAETPDPS